MLLVWRVDIVGQAVMFLLRDSLKHHCQRLEQGFLLVLCIIYKTSIASYIFHLPQLAEVLSRVPEDPLLQPFWEMKDPLAAAVGKRWAPWGARTLDIQAEKSLLHQLTRGLCIHACSGLWRSHGPHCDRATAPCGAGSWLGSQRVGSSWADSTK